MSSVFTYLVLNPTRQTIIGTHVGYANNAHTRRIGLSKHEHLENGQGLIIVGRAWLPLMVIHTIGMKFTIEVFFLNKHKHIIALRTLPPNRVMCVFHAHWVIETAEGVITESRTRIGDEISWTKI